MVIYLDSTTKLVKDMKNAINKELIMDLESK